MSSFYNILPKLNNAYSRIITFCYSSLFNPNDVYGAIFPVLVLNRLFCVSIIQMNCNENKKYSLTKYSLLIAMFPTLLYSISVYSFLQPELLQQVWSVDGDFLIIGNYLVILAGTVFMLVLPIITMRNGSMTVEFFERIQLIDIYFTKSDLRINLVKLQAKSVCLLIFVGCNIITTFALLNYGNVTMYDGWNGIFLWFIYHYPELNVTIASVFFITSLYIIHQRFKLINTKILRIQNNLKNQKYSYNTLYRSKIILKEMNADVSVSKIQYCLRTLFILYNELCELVDILIKSYNLITIISSVIIFGSSLLNLLYIALSIMSKPKDDLYFVVLTSLCWWVGFVLIMVAVNVVACENYAAEAKRTSTIVHEMLVNEATPLSLKPGLLSFSLQMMHRELILTCSGMFPLDYTLLYKGFGAAATYLLLLLQFNTALKK